jgi:uncharacterized membrane protein
MQNSDPHQMIPDYGYLYLFLILAPILVIVIVFVTIKALNYWESHQKRRHKAEDEKT